MLVPGGFGSRGWEGKILACRVARERGIPYLGICLGMHVAVSEFARHVLGLDGANSTEMDPETPYPGDRPAARAKGGRGPRRDDAARRAGGRARRGDPRARGIRRARRPRASPSPLRGEQPVPARARRGRARRLGDVPGRAARRDRRASGSPVVRREPVPPRVQVTADAAGAAFPRVRGRRARTLAGAFGGRAQPPLKIARWPPRSSTSSPSWQRSRARRGTSAQSPTRVSRYLRDLGLDVDEDDAGARGRLEHREPLLPAPADGRGQPASSSARISTPCRRPGRSSRSSTTTACPERRRDDPRRRQQVRGRGDARGARGASLAEKPAARAASSCCSRRRRRSASSARPRSTTSVCTRGSATSTTRRRRSAR